jgi:hypothetical protein
MQRRIVLLGLLGLAMLLFSLPPLAAAKNCTTDNGVVLISQAAVTAGGICGTTGTAGFPVTINGSGGYTSFKLSSNLAALGLVDGIDIATDNVTLDLNGFTIFGPVSCDVTNSNNVSCIDPCYRCVGIMSKNNNITVRNGRVQGFQYGVLLSNGIGSIVDHVGAYENSATGIVMSWGAVTGSVASHNSRGFDCTETQLKGNLAYGNGKDGFYVDHGGATGNVSSSNGGWGFFFVNSLVGLNQMTANVGGSMVGGVSAGNNNCNGALC